MVLSQLLPNLAVLSNWAERFCHVEFDKVASANTTDGGIDLASKHLNMESSGQKVDITFDPAMIAQFSGRFFRVRIQIYDIVPVSLYVIARAQEEGLLSGS